LEYYPIWLVGEGVYRPDWENTIPCRWAGCRVPASTWSCSCWARWLCPPSSFHVGSSSPRVQGTSHVGCRGSSLLLFWSKGGYGNHGSVITSSFVPLSYFYIIFIIFYLFCNYGFVIWINLYFYKNIFNKLVSIQ